MLCMQDYFYLEDKYYKCREQEKDRYLQSAEITFDDYKDGVDGTPLGFDSYQQGVDWTAKRNPTTLPGEVYHGLGLAGEAGEVVDLIKKMYREKASKEDYKELMKEELGDLLYYMASLMNCFDISMSEVAHENQLKCVRRYKEGYSQYENHI